MYEELTPEERFAAEDAETMVPRALAAGRSSEDIVAELLRSDWSEAEARALVARAAEDLRRFNESPESRKAVIKGARLEFFGGVMLFLVGLTVTTLTFLAATDGAIPQFIIPTGIILVGAIFATRGWMRWRLYGGIASKDLSAW